MRVMFGRFAVCALAVVALALVPGAAFIALADDGSANASVAPSPSFRPPTGVLRRVDAPTAAVLPTLSRPATTERDQLVIFVGGYQTCSCDDHTFDELAERVALAGYDVRTFGQDPRYPYDTYGHIDASARSLRDQIRALAPKYSAIHIVTHSMGGVVADQAFAQGLSSDDGVVTYVSLASPHAGSDAARAVTIVEDLGPSEILRRIGSLARFETRSDAVADLATAKPIAAPAGVVRLDLRESTDVLVTARDARDPGVPSRILSGPLDGHGGILTDPAAIGLTLGTIVTRRVPPDARSQDLIDAAQRQSNILGMVALGVIAAVGVGLVLARLIPQGRMLEDILAQRLPSVRRKRCP